MGRGRTRGAPRGASPNPHPPDHPLRPPLAAGCGAAAAAPCPGCLLLAPPRRSAAAGTGRARVTPGGRRAPRALLPALGPAGATTYRRVEPAERAEPGFEATPGERLRGCGDPPLFPSSPTSLRFPSPCRRKEGEKKCERLLTYLVACFVRFLQPHAPLVVQLDAEVGAAVGVLLHPPEKLLQLPPQRRVLLAPLGVAAPRRPLCGDTEGTGVRATTMEGGEKGDTPMNRGDLR